MSEYTNLFYWKWDDEILEEGNMEHNLKSIIKRSNFETIYICVHNVRKYSFTDTKVISCIEKCCEILHQAGRKLLLDIEIRFAESKYYDNKYPGNMGLLAIFVEIELDGNGCGSLVVNKPEYIINSWAVSIGDNIHIMEDYMHNMHIKKESMKNIKGNTYIEPIDQFTSKITVNAGKENANKKAVVVPAMRHHLPDTFSPQMYEYYGYMFDCVRHIPLDGVANDEWGYGTKIEYKDGIHYSKHFPYSPFMSCEYEELTCRKLEDDLIYFMFVPENGEGKSIDVINRYLEVYRNKMKENNTWFYNKGKEYFGKETFIGVHPTLWGDETDFYIETLHNAMNWWEVKRDFAQTDESVLMPIRLALAHKWGGAVWYNMWYSNDTGVKETYYRETWVNARYGGRTHYLGYDNKHEPGQVGLKKEGVMELMCEMEEVVLRLNDFQVSQPDSKVLVLFGIEAVSNWKLSTPGDKVIYRNGGTLSKVLKFSKDLFGSGYLCDLIPTYEVTNGSLTMSGNKLMYGTQVYDAAILIAPEGIRREVLGFIQNYYDVNKNLIIIGECNYFSDGKPAMEEFKNFVEKIEYHVLDITNFGGCAEILKAWDVPGNIYRQGCVYQDGSAIFTTNGLKNKGNKLKVDEIIKGHRVQFEGEDFMAIELDDNGALKRFKAVNTKYLRVDGENIDIICNGI